MFLKIWSSDDDKLEVFDEIDNLVMFIVICVCWSVIDRYFVWIMDKNIYYPLFSSKFLTNKHTSMYM